MKRTLLSVLTLAVIPVGVDAQVSDLAPTRALAERGNARAQFILGSMYASGEGVPEDDAEAVCWYRLAAEQGNDMAQYNLGYMYERGEGVPEDYVLAYMWWNLAAVQGDDASRLIKESPEQRMTREQIVEAHP